MLGPGKFHKGLGPQVKAIRVLTKPDLSALAIPRPQKLLARLRDPHHALAWFIAAGYSLAEAARRAGYSYSRAVSLRSDPAFSNLILEKGRLRDAKRVQEIDYYMELATANMMKAERMIAERLEVAEEDGEYPPMKDLLAISRDGADRFGYGKKQTNLNVNVDLAAKLERAIKRSSGAAVTVSESSRLPVVGSTRAQPDILPSAGRATIRRRI